ncbi:ATP phosphoribosyltransferase regulatory subunit [Chelatococcus reniformis]|nr:ATP phosphoribosyltransferase regulatory subunit [Chelatococcus reniformis]
MPTPTTDELLALFARAGYRRVEPPILQPVDAFLDLSGEDIRRRLFVTTSGDGDELCLRPEYTIPVCRHVLAEAPAGGKVAHSYLGPVFRLRAGESGEFLQAGIESFGRTDREAADAEVIGLALEACAELGLAEPHIVLGDMALITGLIDALGLDAPTKRRVLRGVTAGRGIAALEADANGGNGADYAGLLTAIEGQDPKAARAFVEDVLNIAGISTVGGRTAGEIADRFLARAARRADAPAGEAKAILERYLAVRGDPDAAAIQIRKLAADASLDLGRAVDAFEARTGFMAARGMGVERIAFSAEFARNLDYYTGFIFEVTDPRRPEWRPVAAGGRYDGLLEHLGAPSAVPAVGGALWLDRLGAGAAGKGGLA